MHYDLLIVLLLLFSVWSSHDDAQDLYFLLFHYHVTKRVDCSRCIHYRVPNMGRITVKGS